MYVQLGVEIGKKGAASFSTKRDDRVFLQPLGPYGASARHSITSHLYQQAVSARRPYQVSRGYVFIIQERQLLAVSSTLHRRRERWDKELSSSANVLFSAKRQSMEPLMIILSRGYCNRLCYISMCWRTIF
ncbi:hypothetical protein AOLI_G00064330 [Acnodon oligacanthus]